ncbi:MAG TPA: tail fiber protein [Paracoccaceae bacterium]|nr:tail fiber protein [Paracoccaceae bacterium]
MEPFIAQIMLFGGNFAPRGWAFCDGQLLPISSYSALFSLIGTQFGGDGRTTFALPDLRGRVPMHAGTGPGLTPRQVGQRFGEEQVTLNATQIPSHSHTLKVSNATGDSARTPNAAIGTSSIFAADVTAMTDLNAASIGAMGGSRAHDNMQPTLCINYIIALEGIFPPRS